MAVRKVIGDWLASIKGVLGDPAQPFSAEIEYEDIYTADYGLKWEDLGVIASDKIYGMAYLGNGIVVIGDNSKHVYRSTDYGATWSDLGPIASGGIYEIMYLGNGIVVLGDNAKHVSTFSVIA